MQSSCIIAYTECLETSSSKVLLKITQCLFSPEVKSNNPDSAWEETTLLVTETKGWGALKTPVKELSGSVPQINTMWKLWAQSLGTVMEGEEAAGSVLNFQVSMVWKQRKKNNPVMQNVSVRWAMTPLGSSAVTVTTELFSAATSRLRWTLWLWPCSRLS